MVVQDVSIHHSCETFHTCRALQARSCTQGGRAMPRMHWKEATPRGRYRPQEHFIVGTIIDRMPAVI